MFGTTILALAFALLYLRRWQQLKREVALRIEAERLFRETLEHIKLLAIQLDTHGNLVFCNDYFLQIVGWERREVIGVNWFDRFVPPDQKTVKRIFYSSLESGNMPVHVQNDIVTCGGKRLFISWTNTVIRDSSGAIIGTMSIGDDITERTKAENALLNYQEEFRNLAAELSLAEERERRRLSTDLHDLIGQTLAFAKIRAHSLREHVADDGLTQLAELTGLLDQSIQDVRSLIFQISPPILYEVGLEAALEWLGENFQDNHGFRVTFSDDNTLKPLREEIKVTLFQVVREVLINATKHASPDTVHIDIRGIGESVRITVRDDGRGFDVAKAAQKSRDRSGAGFGLFNIRQRIERLGGSLAIESTPGSGTMVTVVAPLERARDDR
ncbi:MULTISPECIES: PAS domain-containing sensor histidine kinase [Geobacter]|uniref:Oxygen sensor histidine kinase NreB n=2 Tax=Geobacter TaxID=28231 RepID=A0A0C1QT50_9BACT|nr:MULTISPECIES: PAS domain-containing sensor histidine kinase [Geobacter]ANA41654.1 histidine kinase [Geobacter anodireducens]KIE44177.1 histidine kinase [Geobacter soli]MBE2888257.1 PAS domain S-box protein [Geobacter anodireducens]HMN02851.1 PAS domain-containing sensor histidine kinase [Geobacter anodireducens]